jgi:RNA polymerase sigma-70 factor, ECF subfamily
MRSSRSTASPGPHAGEAALVDALRRGDGQAFDRLVQDYGPAMLARARQILRDEEDARDAFQLALVSVFRHIRAFEQRARLSTWLHSVTSNAALTVRRQRTRRLFRERPLADGFEAEAPPERSPERQLIARQRQRLLADALERLAPAYRSALTESLSGGGPRETASRLSLSRSALKSRRFRALRMLRAQMAGHLAGSRACEGASS